ncbi:MAG TPA: RidA family protein [Syntrophales bacterium]|nr:RidA family protein [Syntrophales bacterium]
MSTVSERKIISTPHAPKAIGPYAQAVQYGDLLFVSGMIPLDPKTGELLTGNFEAEVVRVLENIKAVVEASGMSMKNVLKSTVFLKDLGNFGKFNEIYGRYFGDILPARETVQAAQLPRDVSIEISVICGK